MECKNPNCRKKLKKGRRKYCSNNCQSKDMYLRKKAYYKKQSKEWKKLNPEEYKKQMLKANKKFRTEKRERYNELMRNQYHRDKPKWKSRQWTYQIINDSKVKKTDIDNFCKKCKSKNNLSLKFEVYPNTAEDIRKAIADRKIYYLCKNCRFK